MSDERDPAVDAPALPAWMEGIDPSQIGFPLPLDRERYRKRPGIVYKSTDRGDLQLDAYHPVEGRNHPLVMMIHGGAWQGGGRFQMGLTKWAGYLASAGMAVASVDYRLAPGTQYPEPFRDCLDALDWCVENCADLHADPARIGLWGDSAGGHLALLLATSQTRPDFSGPRMRSTPERLRAVAAWYPPTDLLRLHRAEERSGSPFRTVQSFVGAAPEEDPERWREASPIEQAHAGVPPTLLLQGTRDLLVPHSQATRFAERLRALGAECELHVVENGLHGFERLAPTEQARELIARCRDFLFERLTG